MRHVSPRTMKWLKNMQETFSSFSSPSFRFFVILLSLRDSNQAAAALELNVRVLIRQLVQLHAWIRLVAPIPMTGQW
jgi:hypothetical protein